MKIGINALFQARGGSLTNLAELLREWRAGGELASSKVVLFASGGTLDRLGDAVRMRREDDSPGSGGRTTLMSALTDAIQAVLSDPDLQVEMRAASARQVLKFPTAREAALATLAAIRDAARESAAE